MLPRRTCWLRRFETVETAVGIFLEEVKVGDVVFDFVVVKIAEDAEAGLFILEKEAAKSALNS